ncbi:MAG: Phosphoesterase RecJ domain protein [Candidatus Moranbacteria bacterium GW2011_GWC2_37_73]|nr:MAG: exopolyphosphatase-related protein [Parcubacteria group bacterium GW2011_GWC1_36_108]KKQ39051.1 MAG: Phosphoesterase RecJ domain protein [Candidatus Moranbacteria bacterium GW2011_GWC2_37_73]
MSLDLAQQLDNVLKNAKHVLIFMAQDFSGDAVGSAWATYFFLKKNNIEATVVVPSDENYLQRFSFLTKPEDLMDSLAGARDFVLAFNTKFNKITNVRTERVEDELRIFITPEKGSIDPRDFSFIPAKFKYDLVIVLGSPDKESLGKVYEENPDIFYEVPVVNIDHHTENDNFGQVNIVDITASSTSEVVADLFSKINEKNIDENMAESLLTGIIDATNSFQKKNTSPKSLQIGAMLMTKGADQQKIIRYLYKTQPLHLLKLWGRVMARLYWEDEISLAWAPVFLEDFVQSRSKPSDVPFILDKIKENYSAGKIFMVLYNETPGQVRGVIKCINNDQLKKVAEILEAKAIGDVCEFSLQSGDTTEAGQHIVEKLRTGLIV